MTRVSKYNQATILKELDRYEKVVIFNEFCQNGLKFDKVEVDELTAMVDIDRNISIFKQHYENLVDMNIVQADISNFINRSCTKPTLYLRYLYLSD